MPTSEGPVAENGRFLLLDRDGTIHVDRSYITDPTQLELLPGAADGLRTLQRAGFKLVVITNQSVVGRGRISPSRLDEIHDRLRTMLEEEGVRLDALYVCPHAPWEGCGCRKPLAGLVRQAESDLRFRAETAFVIGDEDSDITLGHSIGAATILVRTGHGRRVEAEAQVRAGFVADGLAEAADYVLAVISGVNGAQNPEQTR